MNMSNASDEKQLATDGFIDTSSCPGCKLLRNKIKELRDLMRQAAETVEACGHTDVCKCCWCKMRKLFTAEAAKTEPSAT